MPDIEDHDEPKSGLLASLREHFDEDLTESWSDLVLLLTCFITGLLDSAVFSVWSCFVSMQTGNTIYVGLGVSKQPKDQPWRWAKSGTAIVCFILGSFIFSRGMRLLGPLRRGTMVLSFAVQAILTLISAALVTTSIVPENAGFLLPDNFIVLLPLGLLSVQSAGQIVVSRILGYSELTTVVLTSAYCDLVFDEKVLTSPPTHNVKRNRRVASMVMVILGAILGGFLTQDEHIHVVLWICFAIKAAIAIMWVFWKSKTAIRLE